jgi:hypothetical protein
MQNLRSFGNVCIARIANALESEQRDVRIAESQISMIVLLVSRMTWSRSGEEKIE